MIHNTDVILIICYNCTSSQAFGSYDLYVYDDLLCFTVQNSSIDDISPKN